MTRGSDVFMPHAVTGHDQTAEMPLLAHELSHAAEHIGASPGSLQRAPLVLAQRHSGEEERAEQIERSVALAQRSLPAGPPMTLLRSTDGTFAPSMPTTLSRRAEVLQREGETTEPVVATPTPGGATAAPDAGKLAEQVYSLLERRLQIERERGGYRR
jgi:hypothetical protein